MNYRHVNLQSNIDISTAGTKTYDINLRDAISRLSFKFNVVAHSTAEAMADHPADTVTKIALKDGSDVISSLSGSQLMAAMYYDRKVMPQSYINQVTNAHSYFTVDYDFGRWLWDPELAFDPKRFDNPQIEVTYDKAQMATNAASMYMTIMAECFDGKQPSPTGFLSREEVTTWTPATSTKHYHTIPVDQTIRKLFIRGRCTDNHVRKQIAEMKLTEDHDKKVVIDTDTRSYIAMQFGEYPMINETYIHAGATTPKAGFVMASYETYYTGVSTAAEDVFASTIAGNAVKVDCASGGSRLEGRTFGYIPLHTLCLPFGDQNNIDDWYDVSEINDLELQTKAGTVGTTPLGYVYIENLRRY